MALTDSIVAYWKLDEASGTRNDSVGSNHLADNNTVGSAAGKLGSAADFEAGNLEWLSRADNADLSVGDIDFTFAAWVRLESKPAVAAQIVSKGGASSGEYFLAYSGSDDRFAFQVFGTSGYGGQGRVAANNLGSPSTGTWYFVVAWHDALNNQLGIAVNGGTADTASHSAGVFNGTDEFALGISGTFSTQVMDGLIDEVGFWKRVLTSGERTQLYNSGNGLTYPFGGGDTPLGLSGSAAPSGVLARAVSRGVTGTLTPSVALARAAAKPVAGSATPSGSIARAGAKALTGTATTSGTVVKAAAKPLAGAATPDGVIANVPATARDLNGGLAPSGSLARGAGKWIAGAATPAGSLAKASEKALTGAVTPPGALAKGAAKSRTGAVAVNPPGPGLTPLAYWPYDGSLQDFSGNGYHQSATAGTPTYPVGRLGRAVTSAFGVRADGPLGSGAIPAAGPWSLSFWAFWPGSAGGDVIWLAFDPGTGLSYGCGYGWGPAEHNAYVGQDAPWEVDIHAPQLEPGEHLVCVTADGSTLRLYTDGALTATADASAVPGDVLLDGPITVYAGGTNWCDDCAVYDFELSPSQVSDLWYGGAGRRVVPAAAPTLTRSVGKALAGAASLAGALARGVARVAAGLLSLAGVLTRTQAGVSPTVPRVTVPGADRSRVTLAGADRSRASVPGADRSRVTVPSDVAGA